MTQAQLEAAARKLCELRGVNPDPPVGHSVEGSGAWHTSPAWYLAQDEIENHININAAIAFGLAS